MVRDILKGLVEEVRALYKKVGPIKETYAKRLKEGSLFFVLFPLLITTIFYLFFF